MAVQFANGIKPGRNRYVPVASPFPKDVGADEAVLTVDRLCAVLGHELRSPVGAALLHAALAEMQLESGIDLASTRQAVATIKEQMVRLDGIINRLVRFFGSDEREVVLRREPVDLAEMVPRVITRVEAADPEALGQVTARFSGNVRGVWDPGAVEEVVWNLVGNAVKYGEGRPVQVTVHGAGGEVRLRVWDQGIGIAFRDHRRIFERFVRAVPAREYPGLGLGLWIVKRLVTAHGGATAVYSAPGQGSIFTVQFPRE
jgi:signal transduction histidine kinase